MQQSNAATGQARQIKLPYQSRPPKLLIKWEPWWPRFLRNLRDTLAAQNKSEDVLVTSAPGEFWPDVFVRRPLPWINFGESTAIHLLALVAVVFGTRAWLANQHLALRKPISQTQLIHYDVSEYLPPIPKLSPPAKASRAQKGVPALASQEIISVPKSPDNSRQTILNPPHPNILPPTVNVDLPNLVAWNVAPQPPIAALSHPKITMPAIEFTPVPPPPDVSRNVDVRSKMALPEIAAVQPAPDARRDVDRKMPKLPEVSPVQPPITAQALKTEMARIDLQPTVDVPKLPVPEPPMPARESLAPAGQVAAAQPAPLPPAPSTRREYALPASGQLIALSVQPRSPEKELKIPDGSRSGIFAASPNGKVGAPGIPETVAAKDEPSAENSTAKPTDNAAGISISGGTQPVHSPSSAVVAAVPKEQPRAEHPVAGLRTLMAKALLPDIARRSVTPTSGSTDAKIEDRVFAGRRIYSMQLNMPNLTSAGGSWIIRFAELADNPLPGDLSTPVAINKVDPAYPQQMIRDQVEGNVLLYAIIHADGSVGEVRILEGFQDQLNENARLALTRWHFRPAMKNGVPVDLEAVVQIPFRARRVGFKY